MAYFVSGNANPDVAALRSQADNLSGSKTTIFTAEGRYYYRVDAPLSGEKLGYASDVSLIGGDKGLIQNVTQLVEFNLYQVTQSGNQLSLELNSSGSTSIDSVLGQRYPGASNNSIFQSLTVAPGKSSTGYLPEFYLEVGGSITEVTDFLGQIGQTAPDIGRTLVVRGELAGQRDAAWGNWVDGAETDPTDPTGPTQPPSGVATLDDAIKLVEQVKAKYVATEGQTAKIYQQLFAAQNELTEKYQRINDLNAQEINEYILLALKTTALLGTYAKLVIPSSSMTVGLEALNLAQKGYVTIDAKKTFDNDPTLAKLQKLDSNATSFLLDTAGYSSTTKTVFSHARAVQSTYDFWNDAKKFGAEIDSIEKNTELLIKQINDLHDTEILLKQKLNFSTQSTSATLSGPITVYSEKSVLEVGSDKGAISFGFGIGESFNITPPDQSFVVAFKFGSDKQSVSLNSGNTIVDGSISSHETAKFAAEKGAYSVQSAGSAGVLVENASTSSLLVGVDRIEFSNAILATDVGKGENAGMAYRLYQAAFARTPDEQGLKYWMDQLDKGTLDIEEVAQGFLSAPEFAAKYGASVSNTILVDRLYENILGRKAEESGYNYWINILETKAASRSEVLATFSESTENLANVEPKIDAGIWFDLI